MHYNVRNILGTTAVALAISIFAPAGIYAQTITPPEKNKMDASELDSLNFDTNVPDTLMMNEPNIGAPENNAPAQIGENGGNMQLNNPIPLENSGLPNINTNNPPMPNMNEGGNYPPMDMGNPENRDVNGRPQFEPNRPMPMAGEQNMPMAGNPNMPMPMAGEQNMPMPMAGDVNAPMSGNLNMPMPMNQNPANMGDSDLLQMRDDIVIPSKGEIPDIIESSEIDLSGNMGDNILNKVDNNLFSKMSTIEKQSALLSLELRREKIRNEIEAIKAQRKKAQDEIVAAQEEKRRKQIEWENEQQRKLLVEQQKLKELENKREALRQEKIVKAYKESMLEEKQKWIKNNETIYQALAEVENERDMLVNDVKIKFNNLKNIATKTESDAQQAKGRYDKAVSSLKTQISVLKSRLEAEIASRVKGGNPFASLSAEKQLRLTDVYAVMEIIGKGENLAAKLINKNGDHFMVRKGTTLQTGHVIDELSETYVRADRGGVKDYLYFSAGGILDNEPVNNGIISGAKTKAAKASAGKKPAPTSLITTPGVPSLGDGMFVR